MWISNSIVYCEVHSWTIKTNSMFYCHFLIALLVFLAHALVFCFICSLCWNVQHVEFRSVSLQAVYIVVYTVRSKAGRGGLSVFHFNYLCFLINRTEEKILQLQLYHAWDIAVSCWGKICSVCIALKKLNCVL